MANKSLYRAVTTKFKITIYKTFYLILRIIQRSAFFVGAISRALPFVSGAISRVHSAGTEQKTKVAHRFGGYLSGRNATPHEQTRRESTRDHTTGLVLSKRETAMVYDGDYKVRCMHKQFSSEEKDHSTQHVAEIRGTRQ